jgi:hypothetical protein
MSASNDHTNLHRTAKYFMDSGKAESAAAAVELLHTFGLSVYVGKEIAHSTDHQNALLTLVNCASRTLLAGVEVVGLPDVESLSMLAPHQSIVAAVQSLGGRLASVHHPDWPRAIIGTANNMACQSPSWQLTWEGWRGGVTPFRDNARLSETKTIAIAPALAAATAAAEVFAFHAGDHQMAGRRSAGLSLWRPGADWRQYDPAEQELAYLPSRLWLIGLGNLGQAFTWLLTSLPYAPEAHPLLVLQDFDSITKANHSTSLLTFPAHIGKKKTRNMAGWLEARGFSTMLEERRFGSHIRRTSDEPGAAFCGVDNAVARASLEQAGFGLIVEAGLGAGPQAFRNISLHTFPASRTAEEIWSGHTAATPDVTAMPAYQSLLQDGMDACGVAQLASRTVAVPFVGLTAASLAIAEFLRRLNGGQALELASLSMLSLEDIETVLAETTPYAFGYSPVAMPSAPNTE